MKQVITFTRNANNYSFITPSNNLKRRVYLLFIMFFCIHQSIFAQSVLDKKITIKLSDVSIANAFNAIEDQAGVTISYSSTQLNVNKKVSIDARNEPLKLVIYNLLSNVAAKLNAQGNTITIQGAEKKSAIKGTVKTSDGQPAEFVTVEIKGLKSTRTDEKGRYTLSHIEAGNYTVTASFVGLKAQTQQLVVDAGELKNADFILAESGQELKEVIVNGTKRNKFADKETDYVARMPLKNIENPQVYNVVGKAIMEEQIITDYKQSLRNIAGGGISAAGLNNGFTYTILRGMWTGVRLRNGVASHNWSGIDPAVVERTEAMKGPSGTLYGNAMTSFGGLINLVTKQPFAGKKVEVEYTLGSYDLNRIAVDVNTPLNQDQTVLFRLNAAHHTEGSFRDWGFNKRYVVAPSLQLHLNEKLKINFDAEFYSAKMTLNVYPNPESLGVKNFKEIPLKYNQSIGSDDAISEPGGFNFLTRAEYKISENWTSTTVASINKNNVSELVSTRIEWLSANQIKRNTNSTPFRDSYYQFQQFFNTNYKIAGLKNKFVVGVDLLFTKDVTKGYSGGTQYADTININEAYSPLSLDKIKAQRATLVNGFETLASNVYSAYASNVTNLTQKLSVMVGLRLDRLNNKGISKLREEFKDGYYQTALSPKFGAVYQIINDQLSVFSSYTNAFENNAPVRQPDGSRFRAKPTTGNQFEAGIKTDLFSNKLTTTVSYFYNRINNSLRTNQQGFSIQDDKQRIKGFEIDLAAEPISGLNINAGYGYNHNSFTKTNDQNIVVKSRNYLPAEYANLWISYKIRRGSLKNVGFGAGSNYVGEINKFTNDAKTDAYFLTDGTVFYDNRNFRLGLKVNNIADSKMWGIDNQPIAPRNVAASVKYRF